MKVSFSLLSTILFSALFVNPSFAQSRPVCTSFTSDSDGDGFGWENDQTCIVATQQQSQCEDRGGFPWGWNPSSETSCRLDETTNEVTNETSPLTQAITGMWGRCEPDYLKSPGHNPTGGNSRSDEVTSASWQRFIETSSSGTGTNSAVYTFDFRETGDVAVRFLFDDGTGDWAYLTDTSWSFENYNLRFGDDLQFIGVTQPVGVGFENINNVETFHMYLTTSYRISCTK